MGNYIAVDLKVVEGLAGQVGRAAGIGEDAALAGLVRLWHRCWADETALVSLVELQGLFTTSDPPRLATALVGCGFLEKQADQRFRVRGSDKYLRIKDGRRKGAEATNRQRRSKSVAQPVKNDVERTLPSASPPNTEHRDPDQPKDLTTTTSLRSLEDVRPPARPTLVVVGKRALSVDDLTDSQRDTWEFIQRGRNRSRGLPAETAPPPDFPTWSDELDAERITAARVDHALALYLRDEHFADRRWPTAVFITDGVFRQRLPAPLGAAR